MLDEGVFTPQPTGGTRVLEANVEFRFPITRQAFEGVAFLDLGQVWSEGEKVALGDLEWTSGWGVRYYSPIGPVRLDVAHRSSGGGGGGGGHLQVVTSQVSPCSTDLSVGRDRCIPIHPGAATGFVRAGRLAALEPQVPFNRDTSFLGRLQLHFSIGQAF